MYIWAVWSAWPSLLLLLSYHGGICHAHFITIIFVMVVMLVMGRWCHSCGPGHCGCDCGDGGHPGSDHGCSHDGCGDGDVGCHEVAMAVVAMVVVVAILKSWSWSWLSWGLWWL